MYKWPTPSSFALGNIHSVITRLVRVIQSFGRADHQRTQDWITRMKRVMTKMELAAQFFCLTAYSVLRTGPATARVEAR